MSTITPVGLGGMAMSTVGSGINFLEDKQRQSNIKGINRKAERSIKANQAAAANRWDEALGGLTKEEQQALIDKGADTRLNAYEKATADVPQATNVIGDGAPAVVKTEAAKQLGDQLQKMQARMQARSRLGAWDDRGLATGINLQHSGQDINRLGDFSMGIAKQQSRDVERASQAGSGIGDMLMGIGNIASMGAGSLAGGIGGGSPSMVPANTGGSSLMPKAPGFFDKIFNWGFSPAF